MRNCKIAIAAEDWTSEMQELRKQEQGQSLLYIRRRKSIFGGLAYIGILYIKFLAEMYRQLTPEFRERAHRAYFVEQ